MNKKPEKCGSKYNFDDSERDTIQGLASITSPVTVARKYEKKNHASHIRYEANIFRWRAEMCNF